MRPKKVRPLDKAGRKIKAIKSQKELEEIDHEWIKEEVDRWILEEVKYNANKRELDEGTD